MACAYSAHSIPCVETMNIFGSSLIPATFEVKYTTTQYFSNEICD